MQKKIFYYFEKTKIYWEEKKFKGWDPYDGLNSFVLPISLKKNKIFRLFFLHIVRLFPFNLRNIFFIPKDYNPKGLALFLKSYINMVKIFPDIFDEKIVYFLVQKILELKSKNFENFCWGYNFDWQSRTFFVPKFTPNIIVSTFIGDAFLDFYEFTKEDKFLKIAESVSNFILKDLNRTYHKNTFCFSYTPLDNSRIFNASLLGCRFLSRVYFLTGNSQLKEIAKQGVEFAIQHQNQDGSWFYGKDSNQKWIDSFHTAFNLEAIYDYQQFTQDFDYNLQLLRGLNYYLNTFFSGGIPKLYSNSLYPIDIHSFSSFIIILCKFKILKEYIDLFFKVFDWVSENMWNRKGYFYYQKRKFYTIKTPFVRWSGAWMFYALSVLLENLERYE